MPGPTPLGSKLAPLGPTGILQGMSLSLRDLFAAHVAASLAARIDTTDAIAERSYALADALMRERARRTEQEEAAAIASEASGLEEEPAWLDAELARRGQVLLDEPAPPSERDDEADERWIARQETIEEYDPRWEADPVVTPGSQRPGLARTSPAAPAANEKTG